MKKFSALILAALLLSSSAIMTSCEKKYTVTHQDVYDMAEQFPIGAVDNEGEKTPFEDVEAEQGVTDTTVEDNGTGEFVKTELGFDVSLYDGNDYVSIKDDSSPILNEKHFEPGFASVKYLKLENTGDTPLEWALNIVQLDGDKKLAEVIDVYVCEKDVLPTDPIDRNLEGFVKYGTLYDFALLGLPIYEGTLISGVPSYPCIAFKMQETAGVEYQNLTLENAYDFQFTVTEIEAE